MTPEQAAAYLVDTDPRFAVTEAEIRGVQYRVFRNTPPHLRALLQDAAPLYGDGDVLVYQGERWNYPEFCGEVRRLASAMADRFDIGHGDRVALAMRNYPELPILIMAVVALGAVAVPLNAWWSTEELEFALEDCGAKLVFADRARHDRIEPLAARLALQLVAVRDAVGSRSYAELRDSAADDGWPDTPIDPDDDFAVLYSSGSTGHPKGAVLTHRSAISAVHSWTLLRVMAPLLDSAAPSAPARAPSTLIATPLFHVTGLQSSLLLGLANGAKMTLLYKWDAEEAIRVIKSEEITRFVGVPTQSADLMATVLRLGENLETLEQIAGGGSKRPAAQVGQLARTFPSVAIGSGWGMTETNALGITFGGAEYVAHPEATGRPTPPLQEMRIVDAEGRDLPVGEVGELIVKSVANMRCYLNRPEDTAESLRDGWLYTGDLARMDENGLIYIVDRMKSIIIRGGENVSCLEVEGAIHHHPDVTEACVFPVPDERLGETVGAVIRLRPDSAATEAQLTEFLAERLARFKIPEHVWLWSEPLPRGATGKLDRRALQEQCLAHDGAALAQSH
jgi:acyl-CoA synthetase (AMP-forming)/AMP-acid ligase II